MKQSNAWGLAMGIMSVILILLSIALGFKIFFGLSGEIKLSQESSVEAVTLPSTPGITSSALEAGGQTVEAENERAYFVRYEDGFLKVEARQDMEPVTDLPISIDALPESMQKSLLEGLYFDNADDLYGFLESCGS